MNHQPDQSLLVVIHCKTEFFHNHTLGFGSNVFDTPSGFLRPNLNSEVASQQARNLLTFRDSSMLL